MNLKKRSFEEWIVFFVCINLGLLTLLFLFVPMYPWWATAVLGLLIYFLAPTFIQNKLKK